MLYFSQNKNHINYYILNYINIFCYWYEMNIKKIIIMVNWGASNLLPRAYPFFNPHVIWYYVLRCYRCEIYKHIFFLYNSLIGCIYHIITCDIFKVFFNNNNTVMRIIQYKFSKILMAHSIVIGYVYFHKLVSRVKLFI